jgi:glycogen synthase
MTVVVLTLTDVSRDARVRRTASAMAALGHEVTVFAPALGNATSAHRLDNFSVVSLPYDHFTELRPLSRIASLCPEAAEIVRSCSREIGDMESLWMSRLFSLTVGLGRRCARRFSLTGGAAEFFRRLTREPSLSAWRPHCGKDAHFVGERPVSERGRLNVQEAYQAVLIQNTLAANWVMGSAAAKLSPELVYCNDLDSLLAGFVLKKRLGAPLVFDAHEIYPEQLPVGLRSGLWHGFYTKLQTRLLPHTDGRITVCDSLGKYFEQLDNRRSFVTIRNVPSLDSAPPESVLARKTAEPTILYHGGYMSHRGIESLIEAVGLLSRGRLVLRGFGPLEGSLRRIVTALTLTDRVTFVPAVPVNSVIREAAQADIGVTPYLPTCLNNELALPNKVFQYMMAGLALASSDIVEVRRLTKRLDNGGLFDPQDVASIASALNGLVSDMERLTDSRRRSYQAAQEEFNWEHERVAFLKYMGSFLGDRSHTRPLGGSH